ncbi:phosphoribosylanthranilate isomerase [Desulfobaculum xiamenense]|uniref:N-(5'-phosphoribosyl)anthranilate isomerase n=1 Tax=Desulfobaculum xiamenense TaxID=995050 RepID=A0A846QVZ1_9BACT|nr:phosphoribosylanthranilate isomerase [Desulfobaculum xiamenense]NJB68799.1 phosphoribosylanthranilate isomerase [Desulfobaculum xiamenense]
MPRTDLAPICPRIQIAGIIDREEADLLVRLGVDSLGFPLRLAVHAPDISDADAAHVIASLPPHVAAVVITYLTNPDEIIALCDALGTARVQLHADVPPAVPAALRALRPDLRIIKSLVIPHGCDDALPNSIVERINAFAPHVDAFLTDSTDPTTGATGATGRIHDWRLDRAIVEASPIPVIIAGGLNPTNVRAAIRAARPAAVDAHTGVEGPDGRKRADLVKTFIREAVSGFSDIA